MASRCAFGNVFVVNQTDPAASDSNPGTKKKPFRTISAAVSKLHAGDKALIYAGEYRETVIVNASGTPSAPITIEAAPNERVVIKGSDEIKKWTLDLDHGSIWKSDIPKPAERSTNSTDSSF